MPVADEESVSIGEDSVEVLDLFSGDFDVGLVLGEAEGASDEVGFALFGVEREWVLAEGYFDELGPVEAEDAEGGEGFDGAVEYIFVFSASLVSFGKTDDFLLVFHGFCPFNLLAIHPDILP